HREELVNPEVAASQRLLVTTGGSTGVPVGFYLQKGVSRPKEQAYLEAQWSRRGYSVGDRVAVIRGAVTSSRSDGGVSYLDATRNWLVLSSYHLTDARLPEYVRLLNDFRPKHLHAYPSAALMLAKGMTEAGLKLDFKLTSVLCGSEKLSRESQCFLQDAFGARVFHWYGHSERVILAAQGRESDHLYFWPTYGYAELGAPDENGLSEVIGTSFHNAVMPLIRYRTGDYVKLPASRDGEFAMMEVEAVTGRAYEFLVGKNGRRVSLTAVNMHDGIFDGLLAVQFFQGKKGVVEFRYQPGSAWRTERESAMRAGLMEKLGDDFSLELRAVSGVEKTAAGKHRWLISEIREATL
ncbi:MAG: phenylacetate--CoA ligase family protein, partial [Verrucomicrobiales bacterium]|nr:phenylacetate--CoA ligase family protein [Verrucomicrobiales bacterium]